MAPAPLIKVLARTTPKVAIANPRAIPKMPNAFFKGFLILLAALDGCARSIPGSVNGVAVYSYGSVTMRLPQIEFGDRSAGLEFFAPGG